MKKGRRLGGVLLWGIFLAVALSHFTPAIAQAKRDKSTRTAQLSRQLEKEFGIVALAKTDEHSPIVLENLLFLLRHAVPAGLRPGPGSLKFIFAYAGHDDRFDMGAYHEEAKAISVGGRLAYAEEKYGSADPRILATLAHELGHAYLFDRITPPELRALGEKLGGWGAAPSGSDDRSLRGPGFLVPHPDPRAKGNSITSRLAAKNIHEWFADAYAAAALLRLGEGGHLGEGWREKITKKARREGSSWVDYNLVSGDFRAWLESKAGAARMLASQIEPRKN